MLDPALADRALGAIWGSAVGDALGAPYEFHPPIAAEEPVVLRSSELWEEGEWTDDTSMAVVVLRELAAGRSLNDATTLGRIVHAWKGWAEGAKDVGNQTRAVLSQVTVPTEALSRAAAYRVHLENGGRSAGNGSLMRTGPVALAHLGLGGEDAAWKAAARLSELTHHEKDATQACQLWTVAIRQAILTGRLDFRTGLNRLPAADAEVWSQRLQEAEEGQPADFANNGWVVTALQAAVSAIHHGLNLQDILERAVRAGYDTDTVAAIAGSLAGAVHGASALPQAWVGALHGWPGMSASDLAELATTALRENGAI